MADGDEETGADVTVVNVDAGGDDAAPAVVVADQSDPWPTITAHAERLTVLEAGQAELAARLAETAVSADVAQMVAEDAGSTAEAAVDIALDAAGAVDELAVEAEEAVAAVAEEADAVTEEVAEEVDEIAPQRMHSWFKPRSFLKEKS